MQGSRRTLVLRSATVAAGALLVLPGSAFAGLTPESPASPNAEDSMTAYIVVGILATLLALGVIGAVLAAIRGGGDDEAPARRTRGTSSVQRMVATVLSFVAAIVFVFGVAVTESTSDVAPSTAEGLDPRPFVQAGSESPAGSPPLEIDVTGQRWLWRFEYPGGVFSYHELVVPVDTAIVLNLDSTDVIHRWWVPALGGAFDAVPGAENQTWFRADETGTYEGRSTQFSGPGYTSMRTKVTVLEPTEYQQWIDEQEAAIQSAQDSIQEAVDEGTAPGVDITDQPGSPLPEDSGGTEGSDDGAAGEGAAEEEGE